MGEVLEFYSKIMLYLINKDLSNLVKKEKNLNITKGQPGIIKYCYNFRPQLARQMILESSFS